MSKELEQLIDGMVKAGMLRLHAIAVAAAIEHSTTSEEFAGKYGTFMQAALKDFLEAANANR